MTKFRDSRWYRRITAGSILFGIILVSSVAYAAWTASGGGQGYAKAGTAQALTTVDVSASTTATLFPSGTGDVLLKINNPNPYPVTVATVTGSGAVTSDKGPACNASTGVTFVNQTGLSLTVPAERRGSVHAGRRGRDEQRLRQRLPGCGLHDPGHALRRQQLTNELPGEGGRRQPPSSARQQR